jgi:hypothetical protein
MQQHQVIGLIVMALGVVDAVIGHALVAPRIPDESKRKTIKSAISVTSAGIVLLGLLFFTGRIPM